MGAVSVADLQRWQLFSYLPPGDLAKLARIASQRAYRKGERIFIEGDPADAFWVLLRGQVKVFKLGPMAGSRSFASCALGSSSPKPPPSQRAPSPPTPRSWRDRQ